MESRGAGAQRGEQIKRRRRSAVIPIIDSLFTTAPHFLDFSLDTDKLNSPCSSGASSRGVLMVERVRRLRRDTQSRSGRPRVTARPYYEGPPIGGRQGRTNAAKAAGSGTQVLSGVSLERSRGQKSPQWSAAGRVRFRHPSQRCRLTHAACVTSDKLHLLRAVRNLPRCVLRRSAPPDSGEKKKRQAHPSPEQNTGRCRLAV
jgi:hypothetical protein